MTRRRIRDRARTTVLLATLTLLSTAACTSAAARSTTTAPVPATRSTLGDSAGIAQARADSARHPYTGADIRFMSMMIGHHAQALKIAAWAPTHDASPTIRTLAERITSAQADEIGTMQRWLRDRRQPVPAVDTAAAPGAMDHGAMDHGAMNHGTMNHGATEPGAMQHGALMPGMLTAAQLQELDRARGPEFDRLFLTFMIQHHRGAVAMISELFGAYGAAQDETVFKFASDVNVDQSTEIARMQRMLLALAFSNPQ